MERKRTVTVNGREWEVGDDGRLKDRRETPQDGIRLSRGQRTCLQLMRVCTDLPMCDLSGALTREGLVDSRGLLTPEGKLVADILLSDPAD